MIGLYILIYILVGAVIMHPILTDFMVMCFDNHGTVMQCLGYMLLFLLLIAFILTLWPILLVASIFH